MHEYSVPAGANMEAFVQRKYPQLEGPPSVPPVNFFPKNLLGYLETLVAFCPYYRADDARMAGKMEAFYRSDGSAAMARDRLPLVGWSMPE